MNKVYLALYNPCTEESGYITLSIHKTLCGATKAVEEHKAKEKEAFEKVVSKSSKFDLKYDDFCDWDVREQEILD